MESNQFLEIVNEKAFFITFLNNSNQNAQHDLILTFQIQHRSRDILNQIDVCMTTYAFYQKTEPTQEPAMDFDPYLRFSTDSFLLCIVKSIYDTKQPHGLPRTKNS